jgi:aminoglycoside 6'-N-acetyltransferase I
VSRPVHVRRAGSADLDIVAREFHTLWPEGTLGEHEAEVRAVLAGRPPSTMPVVVFVAEIDDKVVGFVEVGLRSHADGCNALRPVAFIEGWHVEPQHRRRGVGRALIGAAEHWARSNGCTEMASDTWIDNEPSQHAHEALGFDVVDRCVHYRKGLR